MNDQSKEEAIRNILSQNSLAVIATFDSKTNKPEAALITYAENESLELFFGTFKNERKYINLESNPNVALVIGWDSKIHFTLQYEGIASKLNKQKDIENVRKCFLRKSNSVNTEEFLYHPKFHFFLIRPIWIRYSDYTKFEMKFD